MTGRQSVFFFVILIFFQHLCYNTYNTAQDIPVTLLTILTISYNYNRLHVQQIKVTNRSLIILNIEYTMHCLHDRAVTQIQKKKRKKARLVTY